MRTVRGASAAPGGTTAVGAGRTMGLGQQAEPVSMPAVETHASASTVEVASWAGKDLGARPKVRGRHLPFFPEPWMTMLWML